MGVTRSNVDAVTVGVVAFGSSAYDSAARQSVASVLGHTDANVVLVTDSADCDVPEDPRMTRLRGLRPEGSTRRFMTKLEGWRLCLNETPTPVLVLLDADAVFVRSARASELAGLVGQGDFAMVEQTRLPALGWGRLDYWLHYCRTTLQAIDPRAEPPSRARFRFFNSGFVVCRRQGLDEFLHWCRDTSPRVDFDRAASAGVTITDQDFLQFWSNNLHPDRVSTLEWSWNHCSHWDADFPQPDARVVHFSSFYHAPTPEIVESMRLARTRGLER